MPAPTRGRRRKLDENRKIQVCELIARGATMGEASAALKLSLRTVQREALRDWAFSENLRRARSCPPDPLKIMQNAARTHWRAAAWLLERTNPENFGRRPAASCSPFQFDEALRTVLEASLEATDPENRRAVYAHVQAACERAFKTVFPTYGPCGGTRKPQLPETPLADAERNNRLFNRQPQKEPEALARESRPHAPITQTPCTPDPSDPDNKQPSTNNDQFPLSRPRSSNLPFKVESKSASAETHPDPNPNRVPVAAPNPNALQPTPRLPWNYLLRAARTARSIIPAAATSASIINQPILSPKTRNATESHGDNNSTDPLNASSGASTTAPFSRGARPAPPHSATSENGVK